MPDISSFTITGLAGRKDVVHHELNPHVNVCFGPNGSGKTSLLRILHSALSNDAGLLKLVPFTTAEITLFYYGVREDRVYSLSKLSEDQSRRDATPTKLGTFRSLVSEPDPVWKINPPESGGWYHKYLPIARLYEGSRTESELSWISRPKEDTELTLESRFAENLKNVWKDYSARIALQVNRIQEDGLARILASVITRSESQVESGLPDPSNAYNAVTDFLARRGMKDVTLSREEFLKRYKSDQRLRSIATDIEAIERQISDVMAPREALKDLVGKMFVGGKSLRFTDNGIEVDVDGKNIELSLLSSGEKQVLKILVETLSAGSSVVLLDEPELSMHIDWQRRLVSTMRLLNPVSQMIIATHSPEIMAEIPDDQIFRI